MYIRYLKIISNLSLAFGLFGFVFSLIGVLSNTELLYLWLILSAIGLHRLSSKKIFTVILSILIFLPLFFFRGTLDRFFIIVAGVYSLYLISRLIRRVTYGGVKEEFEKATPIVIILTLLSIALSFFFPGKSSLFNNNVFPYLVVYLVSSVVLLRTLRYAESSPEGGKEMNKINMVYSFSIIGVSFLLSLPVIRSVIWHIISSAFTYVTGAFVFAVTWIVYAVFFLFDKIMALFHRIFPARDGELSGMNPGELPPGMMNMPNLGKAKELVEDKAESSSLMDHILIIIAGIVILLVLAYVISILLRRYEYRQKPKEEDYIETKEFITPEKDGDSNIVKKILARLRPKDPVEKIRLYYKRYLLNCKEKGISLDDSDTTLDIYSKSKESFNKDIISKMREIYIQVRYGRINPDSKTVKYFITLYRKLNSR